MADATTADQLTDLLTSHRRRLRERFHVEQIGIFGSSVRGDNRADSDIDVLVEFEKGHKDVFNYMRLKAYLEDLLGRDVDLVLKDALKPRLRDRILSEVEFVG